MGLSTEDRNWIRDFMRAETAASEERIYRRNQENALGEISGRLDGLDARFDEMTKGAKAQGRAIEEIRDELTAFRGEFNARQSPSREHRLGDPRGTPEEA